MSANLNLVEPLEIPAFVASDSVKTFFSNVIRTMDKKETDTITMNVEFGDKAVASFTVTLNSICPA